VIGCAFTVLNTLGLGLLEKVYENALAYEVRAASLQLYLLLNFGKPHLEITRMAHGLRRASRNLHS
jgi:predicted outer membrane lipoprotein